MKFLSGFLLATFVASTGFSGVVENIVNYIVVEDLSAQLKTKLEAQGFQNLRQVEVRKSLNPILQVAEISQGAEHPGDIYKAFFVNDNGPFVAANTCLLWKSDTSSRMILYSCSSKQFNNLDMK